MPMDVGASMTFLVDAENFGQLLDTVEETPPHQVDHQEMSPEEARRAEMLQELESQRMMINRLMGQIREQDEILK